MTKIAEAFLSSVIRDVAELPDRSSPPDAPNMMLVTAEELRKILIDRFRLAGLEIATREQLAGEA